MSKECVKCGYTRQKEEFAPDYECPNCGVIYDKALSTGHRPGNIKKNTPKIQTKQKVEKDSGISKTIKNFLSTYSSKTICTVLAFTVILTGGGMFFAGTKWSEYCTEKDPLKGIVPIHSDLRPLLTFKQFGKEICVAALIQTATQFEKQGLICKLYKNTYICEANGENMSIWCEDTGNSAVLSIR